MWMILCASEDTAAHWAADGLKARGLAPLEMLHPDMLAQSQRWEHRLGAAGVSIEWTLADDRRIHQDQIQGTLNRLLAVPDMLLRLPHPEDREYATLELTAFFLSWLSALPSPVINRPTPRGLSGAWRHCSEWSWLAVQAGLPTPRYRQSSQDAPDPRNWQGRLLPADTHVNTVLVLADQVIGASLSPVLRDGCRRLSHLAHTELLGIDLTADHAGSWTFAGATPVPDLRLGGEALLDALAVMLTTRKEVFV